MHQSLRRWQILGPVHQVCATIKHEGLCGVSVRPSGSAAYKIKQRIDILNTR
jgi:hypothetical protein